MRGPRGGLGGWLGKEEEYLQYDPRQSMYRGRYTVYSNAGYSTGTN